MYLVEYFRRLGCAFDEGEVSSFAFCHFNMRLVALLAFYDGEVHR